MKTKILIAILTVGVFSISTIKAQEKAKMKVEQTAKTAYACPMQCEGEKTYDKAGSCPICKMDLKKVEMKMAEMYACPMHADVKSDKPGVCPKCGMDLKMMEMKKDSMKMNMDHSKMKMMDMKMDHSKMEMKQDTMKIADTYTCPMHPAIKSDKPGACTKCGMDLKKLDIKEKDAHKRHRHQ